MFRFTPLNIHNNVMNSIKSFFPAYPIVFKILSLFIAMSHRTKKNLLGKGKSAIRGHSVHVTVTAIKNNLYTWLQTPNCKYNLIRSRVLLLASAVRPFYKPTVAFNVNTTRAVRPSEVVWFYATKLFKPHRAQTHG